LLVIVIVIAIGKMKCNCNLIVIDKNVIDPCLNNNQDDIYGAVTMAKPL